MNRFVSVPVALALAATCFAQGKTWIVDAAMGAGAHYSDIPPAVAKAVDGDKIIVRKGGYSIFNLTRGVTIIGQPGVRISGFLGTAWIHSIPAGRTAAIHNIDFGTISVGTYKCTGRVVLEQVVTKQLITVLESQQVFMHRCLAGVLYVGKSRLVVTNGRFGTINASSGSVTVHSSQVIMAACIVTGGQYYSTAAPAIRMGYASVLRLTDDGSSGISVGPTSNTTKVSAIEGSGTILLDPRVVLRSANGAPGIASGITVTRRTVPFLDARGGSLGGRVNVTLKAGANHPFFLAVGLPGNVIPIPSLGGSVWLDLNTAILIATGKLDANGVYAWSIPVPRNNVLLGLALVWQGTAGPSLSQQSLSNPSAYVHGY